LMWPRSSGRKCCTGLNMAASRCSAAANPRSQLYFRLKATSEPDLAVAMNLPLTKVGLGRLSCPSPPPTTANPRKRPASANKKARHPKDVGLCLKKTAMEN